jgi:hypothetical protein
MAEFPRSRIEDLSVSRLVMGTNWWYGYSHTSKAKDDLIKQRMTAEKIAEIVEVFLRAGVDTIVGPRPLPKLLEAVRMAQDRTGRGVIHIGTPTLNVSGTPEAHDENCRILDDFAEVGVRVCMPHQQTTDALADRTTRTLRGMDAFCAMIRERRMIPGLSNHMPEVPVYADETGLDVATYIQMYNAIGFLMQIEVDWVHRVIWQAKKPVLTIKPMAAGRLMPLPGLAFSWATIRDCDMVAVGTQTPDEARELIDISLALLDRRPSPLELQRTRSKASVETVK